MFCLVFFLRGILPSLLVVGLATTVRLRMSSQFLILSLVFFVASEEQGLGLLGLRASVNTHSLRLQTENAPSSLLNSKPPQIQQQMKTIQLSAFGPLEIAYFLIKCSSAAVSEHSIRRRSVQEIAQPREKDFLNAQKTRCDWFPHRHVNRSWSEPSPTREG